MKQHWTLEPGVTFLNHGSFGACPRVVLDEQSRLRARLESQPVRFMLRELEPLSDAAAAKLAAFVGAQPEDLVFVPNATAGVNAVLRSLEFKSGDEILVTDHLYPACRNTVDWIAQRSGARMVVVRVPFPIFHDDEIFAEIENAITSKTRLAVLDHVTSPTALVFPMARIVEKLKARGIDTLVDGAHAPGMLPLDLETIGAAYYTGNCHKWLCAPKGAGFLHVRRERQAGLVPVTISHGLASPRTDRSRYQLLFGWTGTADPTAALCVPAALDFMGALLPGGWPALMRANHELAVEARKLLSSTPPVPESMLGSMATIMLAGAPPDAAIDPLQDRLWHEHRIEVPLIAWNGMRLLRVSAQVYNTLEDYERLAKALK